MDMVIWRKPGKLPQEIWIHGNLEQETCIPGNQAQDVWIHGNLEQTRKAAAGNKDTW